MLFYYNTHIMPMPPHNLIFHVHEFMVGNINSNPFATEKIKAMIRSAFDKNNNNKTILCYIVLDILLITNFY